MPQLLKSAGRRRFKGNLHLHTTGSDGSLTPAQAADWYRQRGYDFIAFTDHNVVTSANGSAAGDFLIMSGAELGVDSTELGETFHLVALGISASPHYDKPRATPVQLVVDELNLLGATVILAHPYWSGLTTADMMPVQGIVGVEVFNTSSDRDLGKALAAVQWDDVLARGKRWWGLATDDVHWREDDAGGGWVVVEAGELSQAAILSALREGCFYSSSGPDIYDLALDDGTVTVRCSPVKTINFVGQTQNGGQRRAEAGATISEATYHLRGKEKYLRVECVDAEGRTAWSNPFYL